MKNEKSAITVVVPIYNGVRYIEEVIDSLHKQTVQEFHVLYIDDGSTDGSGEVIKRRLRASDQQITKANSGLYDTLNKAREYVNSPWVAFLFQDDRVKPDWIQRALEVIDDSVDCLWFAIDTIDQDGNLIDEGLNTSRLEFIPRSVSAWISALERGTFWTISGSLSRVRSLKNLPFRSDLPLCADYEFLLRGLRQINFAYFEESLVQIRQHEGAASASNLAVGRDIDERLLVLAEQIKSGTDVVPPMLRTQIAGRMARQILQRGAGLARRGRFVQAAKLVRLLPRAAALNSE